MRLSARHPHPSPFAPSPPVGALATRSVVFPRVSDCPRFLIAISALLAGGIRNLPPLVRAGLALRHAAAFFISLQATLWRINNVFGFHHRLGVVVAFAPVSLPPPKGGGACSGACPFRAPAGGTVPPAPLTHAPKGALPSVGRAVSPYGRPFLSARAWSCDCLQIMFPLGAVARGLP